MSVAACSEISRIGIKVAWAMIGLSVLVLTVLTKAYVPLAEKFWPREHDGVPLLLPVSLFSCPPPTGSKHKYHRTAVRGGGGTFAVFFRIDGLCRVQDVPFVCAPPGIKNVHKMKERMQHQSMWRPPCASFSKPLRVRVYIPLKLITLCSYFRRMSATSTARNTKRSFSSRTRSQACGSEEGILS